MKLAAVKFDRLIDHPGSGQGMHAQDTFSAPRCEIAVEGPLVRVTINGRDRLVPLSRVLWAEYLPEQAPKKKAKASDV